MRIEYDDDFYKKYEPKEYPYPINGGRIERREWEEHHALCEWYKHYPTGEGRVAQLAWERAHGWDR